VGAEKSTGSVEVIQRADLTGLPQWAIAFRRQRKDRRYYEILEDTLRQGFDFRYFIIRNTCGEISAIQPFFLLDQDLLAGTGLYAVSYAGDSADLASLSQASDVDARLRRRRRAP